MAFTDRLRALLGPLRGTAAHPQWLSDRYHFRSQQAVLPALPPGRLLDVGSGDAAYHELLSAQERVLRLDYPATNVSYRMQPDVYGTALALPFADGQFDTVLCLEVLEHIRTDAGVLEEFARVLKPGGQLVLSVPFLYPEHDAPHDFRRYTRFGLDAMLDAAGFAIRTRRQHGNSIVTALQMGNLAMLDLLRAAARRALLLALVVAPLVYLLSLLVNLLATPFLGVSSLRAATLGWMVVAVRNTAVDDAGDAQGER